MPRVPSAKTSLSRYLLLCASALVVAVIAGGFNSRRHPTPPHPAQVYTNQGFGGFVPAPTASTKLVMPVAQMQAAYDAGRYAEAETLGQGIVQKSRAATDPEATYQGLQARRTLAYAAARRKDFSLARQRFTDLRDTAGYLPDRGVQKPILGEILPTFQQEGAFQDAVCTGVLEGQSAAEAAYRRFLKSYPESVLVHAAVKRISRYHDGNVPHDAQNLWEQAMRQQKQTEVRRQREASLCGPECLSEMLRRRGEATQVHALALEMHTGAEGTTLTEMANVARKHGYTGRGLELTPIGLQQQKLPVLALVNPGHFVLVERVTAQSVTVWDPDGQGIGKPERHTYTLADWKAQSKGVVITL